MKRIIYVLLSGVIAAVILNCLFQVKTQAADPKTLESDWTPMQFAALTSNASSTFSIVGIGTSYKIFVASMNQTSLSAVTPLNPAVSYHINWTTDTLKDYKTQITTVIVAGSSETFVPANQLWWDDLHVLGLNPQFVFSSLLANTTLYFQVQYLQPRRK